MIDIAISSHSCLDPGQGPVEIVERKGLGHPDTICDALAEELSLALCRYYRDRFGLILHHNVDKALLWGGAAQARFRGGLVIEPMEIFLAGRAALVFKGAAVPVEELLLETARVWLRKNLRALDAERHVKLHSMIRPGSADLVELFLRQQHTGVALANDTSCGVGFAPLDDLERAVYAVENHLNSTAIKAAHPHIGEDIKVMGVRQGERIHLTVACAFIDLHIENMNDYKVKKSALASMAREHAQRTVGQAVDVEVNAADGNEEGSIYLTVTGTSAEAGDDGEVGRGNRINGLITPYRPMNMEAAAGKNPVTHVGKLYNIAAQQIAATLVQTLPAVQHAQCFLVSRIGHPIQEPQAVDLRVQMQKGASIEEVRHEVAEITREHLLNIGSIQDQLLKGAIKVY